ncbi:hypothetical protein BJ322DRAFT_443595 [Thelephora terrestris]|uniref:RING-type domain-containing protein n=1 Tax=Thelephora terrestris TaxID=56493 RepID=A0A9P6L1W9_9AGAM|nr:hypothetical protein BJ322DRAFT_443595 [Thelephora terrestris]
MQTRSSVKRVTRQSTRGSKRSLDPQEDTLETKRRRTAHKRSRPVSSEAEAPQSSSDPSAPFDEESELVALRKTLQQVQEDLSALQQDQRHLDDVTRGIQHDLDEAQPRDTLRFLEEHFTCALCLEIIAHPVTVPHPSCGHTFCAICMVKHFFSRFHRTCGGWHEHVECPMCRSILIYTPNQLPRSLLTFPFAKNRMADAAVVAMIDQLTAQIESTGTGIPNPCEDLEGIKGGFKTDRESPLGVWRTGGSSRMEWLERLEGRQEVDYLSRNWSTITSQEFVKTKDRLGV